MFKESFDTDAPSDSWSSSSWKAFKASQQPCYLNEHLLQQVLHKLTSFPALVHPAETIQLRDLLAQAAAGKMLVLQAGDCAERFADCKGEIIQRRVDLLWEMAAILEQHLNKPVAVIGRLAGQYAKPRSKEHEVHNGTALPSYRGDIINSFAFHEQGRQPHPERLLKAYRCAALTLNWLRALTAQKRHHPQIFVSHEALLLEYESALTRFHAATESSPEGWFNDSAHFLWLGERTRDSNGAHVEYLRGIENPLGIKVGPSAKPSEIVEICERLNPLRTPGRLTLITRLGAGRVAKLLPALIGTLQESGIPVTWLCDPMHGNPLRTEHNTKTRSCDAIAQEFFETQRIHEGFSSTLAGVHLELTAEPVTECIGGPGNITTEDLHRNYQTYCDPRLNHTQSLHIAHHVGRTLKSDDDHNEG